LKQSKHTPIKLKFNSSRGQCSELPPILRFDVLAHHAGKGVANVRIGEITENGGCFLGWPEGPKVAFQAIMKSALGSTGLGAWGKYSVQGRK
jgi:hypothetical protein